MSIWKLPVSSISASRRASDTMIPPGSRSNSMTAIDNVSAVKITRTSVCPDAKRLPHKRREARALRVAEGHEPHAAPAARPYTLSRASNSSTAPNSTLAPRAQSSQVVSSRGE